MKITEICGYIGMFLVHIATLPTTFNAILNIDNLSGVDLPPLSMILLLDLGLILFLIRSVADRDMLYTISNGIGVFFQSIMLVIILYNEYFLS